MPNGNAVVSQPGRNNSLGGDSWPKGPAAAALGKPPPGRDPKSRARSRDYLKQYVPMFSSTSMADSQNCDRCLQEISYLTSPQAMNPLPNRPLLNNSSLPLALPNVPSFDQMAYNGRPRKVMPEAGKDFPLLNGISIMSGPSSAPAASQPLERSNPLGGGVVIQSHQQQQGIGQGQLQLNDQQSDKDKDGDESGVPTAIFRPDDRGEWKERLRLAHEAGQARLAGAASWDRRDDEDGKDDEGEVEDDESSVVGESEGNKVWHPKRTLRKSVIWQINCLIQN